MPPGPLPPNEAGQVMILEYHVFGSKEDRFERTPAGFQRDLEALYQRGYRPVPLEDLVAGHIDLPRGYSPVVLTFDDGTEGQFRYLAGGDPPQVDPQSAVGVLLAFHQAHPDWALHGTFYLNNNAFGQAEYWQQKLHFLISQGFTIGDHTISHPDLSKLSDTGVEAELGKQIAYIRQALPDYAPTTLALPFGIMPRHEAVARAGTWNDISYHFQAVLLVGAGPTPSPYAARFDPYHLPRIQVTDPSLKVDSTFYEFLSYFDSHPEARYVSDGDPQTIGVRAADAGKLRPGLAGVNVLKG